MGMRARLLTGQGRKEDWPAEAGLKTKVSSQTCGVCWIHVQNNKKLKHQAPTVPAMWKVRQEGSKSGSGTYGWDREAWLVPRKSRWMPGLHGRVLVALPGP